MNPVATARLLSLRIGKCSSGSTSPAFRETFRSSSSDSSKSNVAACMRIIRGMNNSSSSSGSYSCCCFSGSTFSRRLFHSVAYEGPPRASATAASTAIPERAHRLAAADTAADPRMPARGWLLLCCGASLLIGGLGSCLWLLIDSPEPLNIAWEAVRKDPRVRAALGGDVKRGWWWGGFVHPTDARIKLSLKDTANPMSGVVALVPEQLPRAKQQENFMRGCLIAFPGAEKHKDEGNLHQQKNSSSNSK